MVGHSIFNCSATGFSPMYQQSMEPLKDELYEIIRNVLYSLSKLDLCLVEAIYESSLAIVTARLRHRIYKTNSIGFERDV